MKTFTLIMKIETEIEDESELERALRAALDNMLTTPHLDYFDLELELDEGGQE